MKRYSKTFSALIIGLLLLGGVQLTFASTSVSTTSDHYSCFSNSTKFDPIKFSILANSKSGAVSKAISVYQPQAYSTYCYVPTKTTWDGNNFTVTFYVYCGDDGKPTDQLSLQCEYQSQ